MSHSVQPANGELASCQSLEDQADSPDVVISRLHSKYYSIVTKNTDGCVIAHMAGRTEEL